MLVHRSYCYLCWYLYIYLYCIRLLCASYYPPSWIAHFVFFLFGSLCSRYFCSSQCIMFYPCMHCLVFIICIGCCVLPGVILSFQLLSLFVIVLSITYVVLFELFYPGHVLDFFVLFIYYALCYDNVCNSRCFIFMSQLVFYRFLC